MVSLKLRIDCPLTRKLGLEGHVCEVQILVKGLDWLQV